MLLAAPNSHCCFFFPDKITASVNWTKTEQPFFFYLIFNARLPGVHTNMMFFILLSVVPLLLCTHSVNAVCSVLALIEIKCLAKVFFFF